MYDFENISFQYTISEKLFAICKCHMKGQKSIAFMKLNPKEIMGN